jgi:hypothetical protein
MDVVPLFVSRERAYWAAAEKRPWYTGPSRGRCIATALQATLFCFKIIVKISYRDYFVVCMRCGSGVHFVGVLAFLWCCL